MNQQIHIRRCSNEAERADAIFYLSEHMRKKYGSCPPPETTPPDLFAAFEGSTVVGTLGLQFGTEQKPLPFEQLFIFDSQSAPVRYNREQTVYYSRWNSSRPSIGLALWLAATKYAIEKGMIFSSATGKTVMREYYYSSFQCEWFPIHGAKINTDKVGETEKGYFFSDEPPLPWLGILTDQIAYLPAIIEKLQEKIVIIFD